MECIGIMEKIAILSRHIVLCNELYPVHGIIVIQGEMISDIIILDNNLSSEQVLSKFSQWNLIDYSNYYISPGIIDLNVRKEWESYKTLTKAGISGGVTFILEEPSFYQNFDEYEEFFCDVGKIKLLNDQNLNSLNEGQFANKAYLFNPTASIQAITNISNISKLLNESNIPLFIDPNLPDPRMLYMASPFRLEGTDRKIDIQPVTKVFAAAFAQNNIESEESGSEDSDFSKSQRTTSLIENEIESFKPLKSSIEQEFHFERFSKGLDENLKQEIAKESLKILESKKPSQIKRTKSRTIFDDLNDRIKDNQKNIETLCLAENSTYQNSGNTVFLKPIEKKPEVRRRPAMLSINTIPKDQVSPDYNFYLANCPEHWETNGIDIVLTSFISECKIHFQNISSAGSINKIRQASEKNKNLTCEIPASHLFFNSSHIRKNDTRFKSCPPIRTPANFNLLWDLLKMRAINVISSQHVLIDASHKAISTGNFSNALNGICCLGFSLQAVWSTINIPIMKFEQLEHYLIRLSKWLSQGPAKLLGLKDRGCIAKGKSADLIIWNPYCKNLANTREEYNKLSPFNNLELFGQIHKVYLRGKLAYDNGEFFMHGKKVEKK